MSLMRLAFWLALLVLLLPTDMAQQARFTAFANAALERLSTFCDRNAASCEIGSAAWATFLRKAEFGLRLVGDLLGAGGRQGPPSSYGPDRTQPPFKQHPAPYKRLGKVDDPSLDTLPPPDLYEPPWRPPKYRKY